VTAGRVTIVGAGPGDPDLLTLAGARALGAADVVVFDRLVDRRLLTLAPAGARLVYVGKHKGGGVTQSTIEALLVDEARAGSHVVRLKGGDPHVFGRGGEEVDALGRAGVAVVVVPGVSSALAAPTAAGIPVTHRGIARSCTIVSGHLVGDDDFDWDAVAQVPGTIVILMAATAAAAVAARLIAGGRREEEPVAIVHAATTPQQRVARTHLAGLRASGCPFPAPSIIVVGPTAADEPRHAAS
jgi:uroporphyrin-III C-methyltransferase